MEAVVEHQAPMAGESQRADPGSQVYDPKSVDVQYELTCQRRRRE
ncbi:hypothetical protein NSERUTF1_1857 [Nocardia seriolae]|nr:hypothetical protein NSERUTF1_1857 [Nocardia seriolae]